MRDLLPSLTNLPVFYTITVTLLLMLLFASISLYLKVEDDTASRQTLFWSKLVVSIPLLSLGAVWAYSGSYLLGVVALMGGCVGLLSLALAPIAIYATTTWGLIRWIRNRRFGDISVMIVIIACVSIIYSYQLAWMCETISHSGYGFAQLCTAELYEAGLGGVNARRDLARDWYLDAAYSGYASAQYWVGMHTHDFNERRMQLKIPALL